MDNNNNSIENQPARKKKPTNLLLIPCLLITTSMLLLYLSQNKIILISTTTTTISESDYNHRLGDHSCLGRYIYIHDLPSRFNKDILQDCESISRPKDKTSMFHA
ncbi:Exostosin family protein [Raphanus sativus]|nr:Exostosin family protein [Raphanus sativus]